MVDDANSITDLYFTSFAPPLISRGTEPNILVPRKFWPGLSNKTHRFASARITVPSKRRTGALIENLRQHSIV